MSLLRPSLTSRALAVAVPVIACAMGCATPAPLVSLEPYRQQVTWGAGRAIVMKQQAGVRVAAAFEQHEGDVLGVRVEIENQTEVPVDVAPHRVTVVRCPHDASHGCSGASPVINPEHQLRALAAEESRATAGAANTISLLAPFLVLSAVGDVAAVASGKANGTTGLRTVVIANQMEDTARAQEHKLAASAGARERWANTTLRRTTLAPHAAYGGLVYLPFDRGARYVWLTVWVGERAFPFCFEQTVTPVTFERPRPTVTVRVR